MHINKYFTAAFFICNFLLSVYFIDTWITNANTVSRALPIISYFESGHIYFDKYSDLAIDHSYVKGHHYSDKAPLPMFLALPAFGFLKMTGIIQPDSTGSYFGKPPFVTGAVICGTLPFVLLIFLLFNSVRKKKIDYNPVALSMFPFYGSFLFVYSGVFYGHLVAGLFLVMAYFFYKKEKYFFSGLVAGAAFLSEYPAGIILPLWALLIFIHTRSAKNVFNFIAGFIPSIVFIMVYNNSITGSPFDMLYKFIPEYFGSEESRARFGFYFHPLKETLWGLTFSFYRGLFMYAPFLILLLIAAYRMKLSNKFYAFATNPVFAFSFCYILFFMVNINWFGGWSYGPRYLIPVAALLTYFGVMYFSDKPEWKPFLYIAVITGLICSYAAKATVVYSIPADIGNPIADYVFPQFFRFEHNPNNLATILFGMHPSLAAMFWIVLFAVITFALSAWYKNISESLSK